MIIQDCYMNALGAILDRVVYKINNRQGCGNEEEVRYPKVNAEREKRAYLPYEPPQGVAGFAEDGTV